MSTYPSSAWDRLIGTSNASDPQRPSTRLTLAQYKRVIARDLEALLNTRIATPDQELDGFPRCRRSIANFGLADFAELCLSSGEDRKIICDRLTAAIERHEPRLERVRAHLAHEPGIINRLSFIITGRLRARSDDERVQFDVMLQPSNLHYSIR